MDGQGKEMTRRSDDAREQFIITTNDPSKSINVMSGGTLVLGDVNTLCTSSYQMESEVESLRSDHEKLIHNVSDMKDNLEGLQKDQEQLAQELVKTFEEAHQPKGLGPITAEAIIEVKERYKRSCQKHEIHCVDSNNRILPKEVDLNDFAVKLKISREVPAMDNFRDERRQHFENLQDVKGDNIPMSNLTDDRHHVTFIRGIAGMGKSVLAKQLAYGWANGKIYQKFKMCVMFECRDLNYFKDHEGARLKKHEILGEFLKSKVNYDLGDGEGVLVIIDGLDELYDITEKEPIIFDLLNIKGKYYMAKVIITGRPHIEYKLEGYCKSIGGLRKVEILGLRAEQIQEYIKKFSSFQGDNFLSGAIKSSSTGTLPILSVPQFLNTYCCVLTSTMGAEIKDQSELYCWTIYLLLKQHANKQNAFDKKVPQIFQVFSQTLVALSEVCHNLLTQNKIVFEGDVISQCGVIGEEKEFIDSLFVDVSDNIKEKYQFKHLSLMEFLSALHICKQDHRNRTKLIRHNLERGYIEVVGFVCRLLSRSSSEGIIKEILRNAVRLQEEINDEQLLTEVLQLLNECRLDEETKLNRSFEIITFFMTDNLIDKEFILAVLRQCNSSHFDSYESASENIHKICSHLEKCGCAEADIRAAFEHVRFGDLYVSNIETLKCAVKYLKIEYRVWLHYVKTTVTAIQKPLSAYCGGVSIGGCELDDAEVDSRVLGGALEDLYIFGCTMNTRQSFANLCNWGIKCERFVLYDMDFEEDMWQILVETIERGKASGELKMKVMDIGYCESTMCDGLKKRIVKCGLCLRINEELVEPLSIPSTSRPTLKAHRRLTSHQWTSRMLRSDRLDMVYHSYQARRNKRGKKRRRSEIWPK